MRHRILACLVLLLPLAAPAPADTRLEMSVWSGARADWPQIFAWATQKTKVLDLEAENDPDQPPTAQLKAEREKLAGLSRMLGKEVRWTLRVKKERARLDIGQLFFLYRLELGDQKSWIASCSSKTKKATMIGTPYLNRIWSPLKSQVTMDNTKSETPKRDFMGMNCMEYPVGGAMKGKVWVGEPSGRPMPALREFIETARVRFNGFAGSMLYHVVHETGGLPVLARVHGLVGPNLTTGSSRGELIIASAWLCEQPRDAFPASLYEIPQGYKVRKVGIR